MHLLIDNAVWLALVPCFIFLSITIAAMFPPRKR